MVLTVLSFTHLFFQSVMKYLVAERTVDDMQKDSRKKIIVAVTVVVSTALIILSVCSADSAGVRVSGTTEQVKQGQSVPAAKETAEKRTERGTDAAGDPRATGAVMPKQGIQQESRQTEPEGVAVQSVWSPPEENEHRESQTRPPETDSETTVHVHAYSLSGTRTVEHPAVTEQVWVEDSPAWDEVIREGYHVSVVTCHECGAQFPATSQVDALEAWGDHIDAFHDGDGGYDMAASYDVPAEVCHHDAAGHYETRTVTAAWTEYIDTYRCSCGDSYTKTR